MSRDQRNQAGLTFTAEEIEALDDYAGQYGMTRAAAAKALCLQQLARIAAGDTPISARVVDFGEWLAALDPATRETVREIGEALRRYRATTTAVDIELAAPQAKNQKAAGKRPQKGKTSKIPEAP